MGAIVVVAWVLGACGDPDCPSNSAVDHTGRCVLIPSPTDAGEEVDDSGMPTATADGGVNADPGLDGAVATDAGRPIAIDGCVRQRFYADADGDGHGDPTSYAEGCAAPDGWVERFDDCDDACPTCYPGHDETCDHQDNDCNGLTDDGLPMLTYYRDCDRDGYGLAADPLVDCTMPRGYADAGDDCNDGDALVHPGASERCNGGDDNCNIRIDEGLIGVRGPIITLGDVAMLGNYRQPDIDVVPYDDGSTTGFMVAWSAADARLYFRIVDIDGNPVTGDVAIDARDRPQGMPALAVNKGNVLIGWQDDAGLQARLLRDPLRGSYSPRREVASGTGPHLASIVPVDAFRYAVVWLDAALNRYRARLFDFTTEDVVGAIVDLHTRTSTEEPRHAPTTLEVGVGLAPHPFGLVAVSDQRRGDGRPTTYLYKLHDGGSGVTVTNGPFRTPFPFDAVSTPMAAPLRNLPGTRGFLFPSADFATSSPRFSGAGVTPGAHRSDPSIAAAVAPQVGRIVDATGAPAQVEVLRIVDGATDASVYWHARDGGGAFGSGELIHTGAELAARVVYVREGVSFVIFADGGELMAKRLACR